MKLYTKTGDDGGTGLFDGSRVRKDDLRVEAYGTIDELNAWIGLTICAIGQAAEREKFDDLHMRLTQVQAELFTLGAELATPAAAAQAKKIPHVAPEQSHRLEQWIDEAAAAASPLKTFVLPGGSPLAAHLHLCRTVSRRAERRVVTLAGQTPINPEIIIYLNRLSDLFFAWARMANHFVGVADVPWNP
ncbi:MAG TPA: cob(I)yrinic acid a,c-diamide adenosyltransferase [Phycisphaerae bacterium]|nr:cob(I)yrinic acid a,c-diamide adenosyltransferase [Phycisphaerae bacterium]